MANNDDVVLSFKVGDYYISNVWVYEDMTTIALTKHIDEAVALIVGATNDGKLQLCDCMDTFFDSKIARVALLLGAAFVDGNKIIKQQTKPQMPAPLAVDKSLDMDNILADQQVQLVYFKLGHYYVDSYYNSHDEVTKGKLMVNLTLDKDVAKDGFNFTMALPNNVILKHRMVQAITPKELLDIGAIPITKYVDVVTDED